MSLALHAVNSRSINSGGDDEENQAANNAESKVPDPEVTTHPTPDTGVRETGRMERHGEEEEEQLDRLFSYLRDNMETIRELCQGLMQQIPPPDHCTIEG